MHFFFCFSRNYGENKIWPQYLVSFIALLSTFGAGIHMGWPSASLSRLFSGEFPYNVTTEEASYITIIGPVGDMAGNVLWSFLFDAIGRKAAIMVIGIPQVVSMAMIYFSTYSIVLLYVARFIGGLSEGACFTVLNLFICEISEPKIRGRIGSCFSLFIYFGLLFINIIGSYYTIKTTALVGLCIAVVFMILCIGVPESPYYLIMNNRVEDGRASLKKLRAREDVDDELRILIKAVERQMSERGKFKDLFKIKSNRQAITLMVMLRLVQQFSGLSTFAIYTQLLFKEATDAIPEEYATVIMLSIQIISTVVALTMIDHFGRRPMILVSIAGSGVTLITNAVFLSIRDFTDVDVSNLGWIPLVVMMFFTVFCTLGLGTAVNLILGELFPTNVKAKASGLMNMLLALGMLGSTKFYQYMSDQYSVVIPFAVFGVVQAVGFVLSWKWVPETMNKSLEDIQLELKEKKK